MMDDKNENNSETLADTSSPEAVQAGFSGIVFILKNSVSNLRVAENFLQNRKWSVTSSSNLREALAFVLTKRPEIIMIAADHANKKARILPRILMQANLPIKIIGYTESQNSSAIAALHEMGCAYTLYPPISGPAIERMILKIRKDEETKQKDPQDPNQLSATSSAENALLLSEIKSTEVNDSFEQARKALAGLVAGDDDDEVSTSLMTIAGDKNKGHGVFLSKGERSKMMSTQQDPKDEEGGSFSVDPKSKKGYHPTFEQSSAPASDEFESAWENNDAPMRPLITLDIDTKKSTHLGKDSIIVRGTQEALEEAVNISSGSTENVEAVENVSTAACIVVDSPQFKGYLVAALGKNKTIDSQFLDTVKARLFAFLRNHGETVHEEDPVAMDLKIERVPFEDWAIEQAQFLKKSIHGGNEIALAFFPTEETRTRLEESVSDKMLKMELKEFRDDTSVEFDLYIYMPENNKYLLYTPQGKTLYKEQKQRLTDKGITHMHLRKESVAAVKKYKVQNFLNDKIEEYRLSKKA